MGKGRPGGNPDLEKYQFEQKYGWEEPCSAKLTLRLPPSLYTKLKQLPNWQEKVRQAIAALVEEEESPLPPLIRGGRGEGSKRTKTETTTVIDELSNVKIPAKQSQNLWLFVI